MGRPRSYEPPPATVERIETHASVVFLAGPFAYKVKRAVKYPFLDFSTLERRREACLNELRVNRRTAAQLYLEVLPVTLGESGAFRFGGEGKTVEWVLKMRRFDQAKLFDRMAGEGRLDLATMPRLAEIIAAFHDSADRMLAPDQAVRPLADVLRDNARSLCRPRRHRCAGRGKGAGAAQPRAARGAVAVAGSAGERRICAPLPRRSSLAQHCRDRRRAGAVRRHRVRRPARHHRRPLRPCVPADGSRQARARAPRQRRAQRLSR